MTIKKLTVAAAIAVGIATCSFNNAMAACPCDQRPVVTESSCCPAADIPVVTGAACPCEQPAPKCGCEPVCEDPAVPSCAICPSAVPASGCAMQQVYAYPNAIYGSNNTIGDCGVSAATFRGQGYYAGIGNYGYNPFGTYGYSASSGCGCVDAYGKYGLNPYNTSLKISTKA